MSHPSKPDVVSLFQSLMRAVRNMRRAQRRSAEEPTPANRQTQASYEWVVDRLLQDLAEAPRPLIVRRSFARTVRSLSYVVKK